MDIINILTKTTETFNGWCNDIHVRDAFAIIRNIVQILRIVVPIGLIAMTIMDVIKKVLDPNDKDGQKKIMTRAIAAVIVFFIPTLITITLRLIDAGKERTDGGTEQESKLSLSACWEGDSL